MGKKIGINPRAESWTGVPPQMGGEFPREINITAKTGDHSIINEVVAFFRCRLVK